MESRIRKARKAADLTQQNVKDILGIPTRTQQGWESGDREPAPWLEDMVIREYCRISKNGKSRD